VSAARVLCCCRTWDPTSPYLRGRTKRSGTVLMQVRTRVKTSHVFFHPDDFERDDESMVAVNFFIWEIYTACTTKHSTLRLPNRLEIPVERPPDKPFSNFWCARQGSLRKWTRRTGWVRSRPHLPVIFFPCEDSPRFVNCERVASRKLEGQEVAVECAPQAIDVTDARSPWRW
jgi:hypothetical protein